MTSPVLHGRQVVVLAHGLLAGRRSMRALASGLGALGYEPINWSYQSLRGSMVHHAADLSVALRDVFTDATIDRVHLVTHSMGAIIARMALNRSRLECEFGAKCGRFVMLAPPNAGSHLTRFLLGPLACWFPQLAELSTSPTSVVNQLPPPRRMQVGVIAAKRDFVVSVQATHLTTQRDHVVVPTTHQRLVVHPEAIDLAVRFVALGQFAGESDTINPSGDAAWMNRPKAA